MMRFSKLLTERWRDIADWILAVILASSGEIQLLSEGEVSAIRVLGGVLLLGTTLPLAMRRRFPTIIACVVAGSLMTSSVVVSSLGQSLFQPFLGLVIGVYSLAAHADLRRQIVGSIVVIASVATTQIIAVQSGDDPGFPGVWIVLVGVFVLGRVRRWQTLDAVRLRRHAEAVERARDEQARLAVVEERGRIARELHDLIAHATSVIVVQARAGRRSLKTEPELARESFDAIESTGRQALAEMRRLVGLLREDDEELALAPQPSLRHIDSLVGQIRQAGLPVTVSFEGEPRDLPRGVDLTAYRIVQEALTNALKHAGPAAARVTVRYHPDVLELEVVDTGTGTSPVDGTGHGVAGMRERLALYGGQFEVDPQEGRGFAVRARLPLEEL